MNGTYNKRGRFLRGSGAPPVAKSDGRTVESRRALIAATQAST